MLIQPKINKQINCQIGNKLTHRFPLYSYEFAHSTPYYLHRDWWNSMHNIQFNGPIRYLQKYLIKYDKDNNSKRATHNFPNINKWTSDNNIDHKLSTNLWNHPIIKDAQITFLLKCTSNQYMKNAYIKLFFGPHYTNPSFVYYLTHENGTLGNEYF
jgi:hypothetical protein